MFALALSCLQGRPMAGAAKELASLGPSALQLTPGNAPEVDAPKQLNDLAVPLFRHDGFCWTAMRQTVWTNATCAVSSDSVHPPRLSGPQAELWWANFERGDYQEIALETMYPGYPLGTGKELERAMDINQRLAVDVSHLHIQRTAGVLTDRTIKRLHDYEWTTEVHLSANDGRRDQHRRIDNDTYGLDWAKEKLAEGTLVVLECYMHRLPIEERRRQLELAAGQR